MPPASDQPANKWDSSPVLSSFISYGKKISILILSNKKDLRESETTTMTTRTHDKDKPQSDDDETDRQSRSE